jgi:hypothetical protein
MNTQGSPIGAVGGWGPVALLKWDCGVLFYYYKENTIGADNQILQ